MTTFRKTEVRASSSRVFELLMDWFPDIIQSVDNDGNIVYANRKAAELLGYSRDELLGMNLRQLYAPEIWDKVVSGFEALKNRGTLTVHESLIKDKAGNTIPVEIRSFAIYDDDGEFLRTFSILRDQRQVKELQSRLLHANRLAAIGELGACIAHDVANPLAVIKMYGELLATQVRDLEGIKQETAAEIQESLANVERSAQKIEKLIMHLREFSRARDSGFEEVDLRNVVADGLFMVTNKITEGRVTIVRELPDTPCAVRGNASQLEQVFMNLFSNACDAMQANLLAELRVSIGVAPDGAHRGDWDCRVTDNGTGIPPEICDQMFTPFFTTKRKGEGTGLGLSITRNIVRRHGGYITVESEVGKGTVFHVYLPQAGTPALAGDAPAADGTAG